MKIADWADWATAKTRGGKFYVSWAWAGRNGWHGCMSAWQENRGAWLRAGRRCPNCLTGYSPAACREES